MTQANPEIGKSVVAAGLKTNYLEAGEGEPLLLIHGSGPGVTAYANWRLVLPVLSKRYRVLAPDISGFGYTERKADQVYDMEHWVAHLIGFMDAVGVKKAHVVGNSFGGGLTLASTVRHPDRFDRLALMGASGTHFDMTPELDAVWGYQPSIENMRNAIMTFAFDTSIVTDDLVKSRYEASIRPGYQESYSRLFPGPNRQRHIAALATPDEKLRALKHRVLVIHGRDDRIVPLSASLRLHSLIPHSDLHVFGECGHWTQIEKKDGFVQLVDNFFSN